MSGGRKIKKIGLTNLFGRCIMQNVEGKGVFYVSYIRDILVLFCGLHARSHKSGTEEPQNLRKLSYQKEL